MKDEKIMKEWAEQTWKKALDSGLKRHINLKKFVDYWMSDRCAVTTSIEDKEVVQNKMYEMFMGFEKICQLVDKGEIKERHLKLAHEMVNW